MKEFNVEVSLHGDDQSTYTTINAEDRLSAQRSVVPMNGTNMLRIGELIVPSPNIKSIQFKEPPMGFNNIDEQRKRSSIGKKTFLLKHINIMSDTGRNELLAKKWETDLLNSIIDLSDELQKAGYDVIFRQVNCGMCNRRTGEYDMSGEVIDKTDITQELIENEGIDITIKW